MHLALRLSGVGEGDTVFAILNSTAPYQAMMYSSFVGVLVAAGMSIGQRILSIHETVDAWYGGLRATLFGMIILVLAWSLSDLTETLNTAAYLVTLLADTIEPADRSQRHQQRPGGYHGNGRWLPRFLRPHSV